MRLPVPRPQLVGIVNITSDSFSDGGRYLDAEGAIAHAHALRADGADIVELGPASSHPDSAKIPAATEIERLAPVLDALAGTGIPLGVDTPQPEVQRYALASGIALLNDIRGFPDVAVYPALAHAGAKLVVMHSITQASHATRDDTPTDEAFTSVSRFLDKRLKALEAGGIARERLIVDPGMGFFLSSRPEPSLAILARIDDLKRRFGCPVMISVSRKSFLRNALERRDCRMEMRTLAAELFAAASGADFIRTHDVAALDQAIATIAAIAAAGEASPELGEP